MSIEVRRSRASDWLPIEILCLEARRALPRLWCWEEYLAEDLFLVMERAGDVVGALFAWPDDSPVAWVRLAVLSDVLSIGAWLDALLPPMLDRLRRRGTRELAWMDCRGWAAPHLKARGFKLLTEVMTLVKIDYALPDTCTAQVCLRPASERDVEAITAVDWAAFTPYWRYSEATMRRKVRTSPYFTVAELAGEIVGYAEGEVHPPQAHLNRIAVHPDHQGCGIGTFLLHNAILAFRRGGAERVTLNTQADNQPSRRLYRRLGFKPTGERVAVWQLSL